MRPCHKRAGCMILRPNLYLSARPSPPVTMQRVITQPQIIEASVTAPVVICFLLAYCFVFKLEHSPCQWRLAWIGVASLLLSVAVLIVLFFGLTHNAKFATLAGCKGGVTMAMAIVEVRSCPECHVPGLMIQFSSFAPPMISHHRRVAKGLYCIWTLALLLFVAFASWWLVKDETEALWAAPLLSHAVFLCLSMYLWRKPQESMTGPRRDKVLLPLIILAGLVCTCSLALLIGSIHGWPEFQFGLQSILWLCLMAYIMARRVLKMFSVRKSRATVEAGTSLDSLVPQTARSQQSQTSEGEVQR